MIPELGNFSLIIGMAFALCLGIIPLVGVSTNNLTLVRYMRPLTVGMLGFVAISYLLLTYSFVVDDFSVAYVAKQSNSLLPIQYKLSAVWGGHEGSLLFWCLSLCIWVGCVAWSSRDQEEVFVARVLAILGFITAAFLLLTLLTSNPFDRFLPNFPAEGRDLNPLLQDIGLILHPPMLYVGYVGFAVTFAFAIAALLSGRMDSAWARWTRPWALAAWAFLTMGNMLGSWWAYYELGWGGWWFWDPVENASFMPWLAGTALIHSLLVTEQRGIFRNWTILLAITAFSLSLLGTFLVRSGVITSVHSFAADPTRGVFILAMLGVAVLGSLTLFALKASDMKAPANFELFSKETLMLAGNITLTVGLATVLLGTLYPLLVDALDMGRISVGPPYFNLVFVPIMSVMAVVMAMAPVIRWKKHKVGSFRSELLVPAIISIVFGLAFPVLYGGEFIGWVAIGMGLASWLTLATLKNAVSSSRTKDGRLDFTRPTRSYWGMVSGHLGIAITIVGISLVSYYEQQLDVRVEHGGKVELAGYEFVFEGIRLVEGPNYSAEQGQIRVFQDGEEETLLQPERRAYKVQTMGMTEAAIDAGLTRDLYVALGDPLGNGAWAIRFYHKPFIRWIWLGGLIMAIGGMLSAADKRYRAKAKKREAVKSADLIPEASV